MFNRMVIKATPKPQPPRIKDGETLLQTTRKVFPYLESALKGISKEQFQKIDFSSRSSLLKSLKEFVGIFSELLLVVAYVKDSFPITLSMAIASGTDEDSLEDDPLLAPIYYLMFFEPVARVKVVAYTLHIYGPILKLYRERREVKLTYRQLLAGERYGSLVGNQPEFSVLSQNNSPLHLLEIIYRYGRIAPDTILSEAEKVLLDIGKNKYITNKVVRETNMYISRIAVSIPVKWRKRRGDQSLSFFYDEEEIVSNNRIEIEKLLTKGSIPASNKSVKELIQEYKVMFGINLDKDYREKIRDFLIGNTTVIFQLVPGPIPEYLAEGNVENVNVNLGDVLIGNRKEWRIYKRYSVFDYTE